VLRAVKTEGVLRGAKLSPGIVTMAKEALAREISPIDDIRSTARYRLRVAQNLLEEFLSQLTR
jgi:xanthine dehydrogenase iron-sulfur cluster and FAD-binding subunit A